MQQKMYAFKAAPLTLYVNQEILDILKFSEHPIDGAFKIYKDPLSTNADRIPARDAVIDYITAQTKCPPQDILHDIIERLDKLLMGGDNAKKAKDVIDKMILFINKVAQDKQSANTLITDLKTTQKKH